MSNHHESVGKWISTIHRYSMIYKARKFMDVGIGSGQLGFLGVLYRKDGISQDELARKLNIDKTTTARALQKLEKQGFVSRKPSERDRRINLVFLTEKAFALEPMIKSVMKQWTEILVQGFTDDERTQLLDMLKRISDNAVDYISFLEREHSDEATKQSFGN
ncbi:MarR family winged helix-turn-helix transcriptional regulator [Thermoactinomyces mirandus]|uniref:MarR family transcriptional regulator n=1 Tax=Thermoactinomyces mirandus TaxID=2756294 RepID=A0A7W1XTR1_9BACL|nr:MarR family transcriptional regulator [Thermoactinomyces mirandus]MBA4603075.1 MarR family transcriptional regulator [Thermoactinomyces mirandus]